MTRLYIALIAGVIGLVLPCATRADDGQSVAARLQTEQAAHDARCKGVTEAQADLYKSCQADQARLDDLYKKFNISPPGSSKGLGRLPGNTP
jgi:hypothetical protein